MRVIGIKCTKEAIQWVLLDGATRADAVVKEHGEPIAPAAERPEQLAWARKEILELVGRLVPDQACLRVAEVGQNVASSLARAEMDGVVQEALSEVDVPVKRYYAATVRSAFSAKNRSALDTETSKLSCVNSTAKVRREQVVVAAAVLTS